MKKVSKPGELKPVEGNGSDVTPAVGVKPELAGDLPGESTTPIEIKVKYLPNGAWIELKKFSCGCTIAQMKGPLKLEGEPTWVRCERHKDVEVVECR